MSLINDDSSTSPFITLAVLADVEANSKGTKNPMSFQRSSDAKIQAKNASDLRDFIVADGRKMAEIAFNIMKARGLLNEHDRAQFVLSAEEHTAYLDQFKPKGENKALAAAA